MSRRTVSRHGLALDLPRFLTLTGISSRSSGARLGEPVAERRRRRPRRPLEGTSEHALPGTTSDRTNMWGMPRRGLISDRPRMDVAQMAVRSILVLTIR